MFNAIPSNLPPAEGGDEALLDYVFNPGLQGVPMQSSPRDSEVAQLVGELLPEVREALGGAAIEHAKELEVRAIALIERAEGAEAVAAATTEAEALLSEAIAACPVHASAFNNRAQVRQLRKALEEALDDLNAAVRLGAGQAGVLRDERRR